MLRYQHAEYKMANVDLEHLSFMAFIAYNGYTFSLVSASHPVLEREVNLVRGSATGYC